MFLCTKFCNDVASKFYTYCMLCWLKKKCLQCYKCKYICTQDLFYYINSPPSLQFCFWGSYMHQLWPQPSCCLWQHVATHVVWQGSAMGGISGDGWCIFLTAYLCVWVMAPPLREIQLELEISGQCWLPAHSHRPGSVSSTSGSVWAQEEKVRRK